jgi:hypothetical protein
MENKTKKIRTVSVRWTQALISDGQTEGRGVCGIKSNEAAPRTSIRLAARHAAEKAVNCLADRPYLPHGGYAGHGQAGGTSPRTHQLDIRQAIFAAIRQMPMDDGIGEVEGQMTVHKMVFGPAQRHPLLVVFDRALIIPHPNHQTSIW